MAASEQASADEDPFEAWGRLRSASGEAVRVVSEGSRAGASADDDPFETLGRRRNASGEAVPVAPTSRATETAPADFTPVETTPDEITPDETASDETASGEIAVGGRVSDGIASGGIASGESAPIESAPGAGTPADSESGSDLADGGSGSDLFGELGHLRGASGEAVPVAGARGGAPVAADPFAAEGRRGRAGAEGGARRGRSGGRRRGSARTADRAGCTDTDADQHTDTDIDTETAKPVDPAKEQRKAADICYALLTARARTRVELKDALLRKGIREETAELVLGKFDRAGLIDDVAFAEVWVRSRHTYQGLGRRALAMELRRKGVADEVVAEAVAAVDDEAEQERARELVRKKLRTMSGLEDQVKIRRLVGALARKGYAEGMAYRVVREELRNAEIESPLDDYLPD